MSESPHDEVESLKARLRHIDDLASKKLLRAEEADEARAALHRRLLQALMPDAPAPRLPRHERLWALVAMAVLVGSVSAYLMSGRAGLRRRADELLDANRAALAEREAARRETLARLRAGKAVAPDASGLFPHDAAGSGASATAPVSGASGAKPGVDADPTLLAGRVALAPELAARIKPDDALFIVVRLPGDPAGLPLAAIRMEAGDMPLKFSVGMKELVGAPERFLQASSVVVSARVSKNGGGGPARPGDLEGVAAPVAPMSGDVAVTIDQVVKKE